MLAVILQQPRYLLPVLSMACPDEMFKLAKKAECGLGGYIEFVRARFSLLVNRLCPAFEHANEGQALGSHLLFE